MALAASLSGTCCVFLLRYLDAEFSKVLLERDNDTKEDGQYIMSTCRSVIRIGIKRVVSPKTSPAAKNKFIRSFLRYRSKLEQVLNGNSLPQSLLDSLMAACDDFQPPTRPLFMALLSPSSERFIVPELSSLSRSLMAQVASELKEGLCDLDMGINRIGDSFIDALSLSSASKTLKTFRTSASAFTDATKSCWRRFVSLSEISIRDNDFISSATLNEISALPNLSRIEIDVNSMSSCAVIASIVRSTTVRHITVPLKHSEHRAVPKIIKLFSQWQAADQLEVFHTGDTRGWSIEEEDAREFAKYCPKASLKGMVWDESREDDDEETEHDSPRRVLDPNKSLFEILQQGELKSKISCITSSPVGWPHAVAWPSVVSDIDIDLSAHAFRSALDRQNFLNTIKSGGKYLTGAFVQLHPTDGLSADEIHEMLLSLPMLRSFTMTSSSSCSEVSISHGNLTSIPSFRATKVVVGWMPNVRWLFCDDSRTLPSASCLPGLISLNIDMQEYADFGPATTYLGRLRKLTASSLSLWPSNAPDFCTIQTMNLVGIKTDQSSMERMIRSCPFLVAFSVFNRPGHDLWGEPTWEIQNLDWLRHKRLQSVSLSYCLITQADYTFEMSVETMPSLTDFDLQWSKTVAAFHIHDMPHLSRLRLQRVRGQNQRIRVERCAELSSIALQSAEETEELGEVIIKDNATLSSVDFYGYEYNDAEKNGKFELQGLKKRKVADVEVTTEEDQ